MAGRNFALPADRVLWDSKLYLSIAQDGYESYRCIERFPNLPDVWCGNTAWFPGYPAVIRTVAFVGMPFDMAGVLVSEGFFLASLFLLWRLFDRRLTWTSGAAMVLAAVWPGAIYFHVVFGISMCLFGLLLMVNAVRDEIWWLAGIGAFVAFSTHIVGVVGVIALVSSFFFAWRSYRWPQRLWRVAAASAMGSLAYFWAIWLIHFDTGSWTIYWEHQRDAFNNGGVHNPIEGLASFWNAPFDYYRPADIGNNWLTALSVNAHQSQLVLNLALLALIVVTAIWRLVKRDLSPWEVVAVMIAIGVVVMPILSNAWSAWYRHNALMLVALPVLRLPRWAWIAVIAIFSVQAVYLAGMWFGGSLI